MSEITWSLVTLSIFRAEAIEGRRKRLEGAVLIKIPLGWQFISIALICMLAAVTAFLGLTHFTQYSYAEGFIVAANEVASVRASRTGYVERLNVQEGERVQKGTVLAMIRAEEILSSGVSPSFGISAALDKQQSSIDAQEKQAIENATREQSRNRITQNQLQYEIGVLEKSVLGQAGLVEYAEENLERASAVAKRGYLSQQDLTEREEVLLSRRQILDELERTKREKLSQLRRLDLDYQDIGARLKDARLRHAIEKSNLEKEEINADTAHGYVLTAPIAGVVKAIGVEVGAAVNEGKTYFQIEPDSKPLSARIELNPDMARYAHEGQVVRVRLNARSQQEGKWLSGRIVSIFRAPLSEGESAPTKKIQYIAKVDLELANGKAVSANSKYVVGLPLTTYIPMKEQTPLKWLFSRIFEAK